MMHSHAPQVIPFPELGGPSSDFGVFMCFMPVCGSMDAKKKLFCILLLRTFKQRIDSCFQYLRDQEEQRRRYNDYTIHDFGVEYLTINQWRYIKSGHSFRGGAQFMPIKAAQFLKPKANLIMCLC